MRRHGLQLLGLALGVGLMMFFYYGAKELLELETRGIAAAAHPSYSAVNSPHSDRMQRWIEWVDISALLICVVWMYRHPPNWSVESHPDQSTLPE